ncbi:MAG: GNAT family N-acetyltransferase [Phycisphaeraceae bacterium]|nr:GNAT family N-acetyltransferase [Phycisphaeraceae bacterium]
MPIQLIPTRPEHTDDLASICHLAFNTLHERHNVPPDVPTHDVGRLIIGGVINRPDYTGIAAIDNGRILGSNFLLHADEVCGVGPITVDPTIQSKGIGRTLMQWAIDEARRRRGDDFSLRLFQEAINTTSLSLYASLGFEWRDTAALMHPRPADINDPACRPATPGDLPAIAALSQRHHVISRANDAAALLAMGLPAFVRVRDNRVVAYQIATLFGHSAAETNDDLLALAAHTARSVPPPMAVIIVPMSQGDLFRAALARGFRVAKVLNAMAIGPYAAATGPALPSIQC